MSKEQPVSTAKRAAPFAFIAFLVVNVIAVTYPGVIPFNRVRPFVFGLPFVFFWIALWIVLAMLMLVIVDMVESR